MQIDTPVDGTQDRAHCSNVTNTEHYNVIVVGAGFAGLGAAIKLQQAGFDFQVLEKAAEIGGVWRDNSYPGCACDVPSALYSYSFAPNPHWRRFFAEQAEIKDYTHAVARRFDVLSTIRFNHEVLSARWNNRDQLWHLETNAGAFTACFVIMACGPMHKPVTPRIKGIETFQGASFHSAQWDHNCDLGGKRVAVIGSGASAIQFLPEIQPEVAQLTLFQRTAPWVLPKMDAPIPEKWRRRFERYPVLQSLLRQLLYLGFEKLNSSLSKPKSRQKLEARALANIDRGVTDPALRAKLVPNFAIGCKRILQSNSWYQSLAQKNVEVLGGIAEVQGNRLVAADGAHCEVDVIIYATGFEVANPPIADIIMDAQGRSLAAQWQGSPAAFLGTTANECPNLFLTFGPNLYTFSSAFIIIEAQLEYILSALRQARTHKLKTLTVKSDIAQAYNRELQSALQASVWNSGGCTSYFIDKNGRNSTNWPWTTFYMRRRLSQFRVSDYHVTPR